MTWPRDEAELTLAARGTLRQARAACLKYAAVGIVGCAAVAASIIVAPDRSGLFGGALALLMLAIAFVDAHAFIIPDKLTIAAFLLALASASNQAFAHEGSEGMPGSLIAGAIGMAMMRGVILGLAFLGLREIYRRLRRRQGIGLGDVKLAAVAGAWLDWMLMPVAIEIAALTALAVYVARLLVLRHPFSATAKLPFGLFFAPAIWLCWLLQAFLYAA